MAEGRQFNIPKIKPKDQIKEFCNITNASSDIADTYLKKNKLPLQEALFDYFSNKDANNEDCSDEAMLSLDESSFNTGDTKFTLLTWNIDGLDVKDLHKRARAVRDIINKLEPDAVFLQEVVYDHMDVFALNCHRYLMYSPTSMMYPYFCLIMLKKKPTLRYITQEVFWYPESEMGRYLLKVDIMFEGRPISLFTTHLESLKDSSGERVEQLSFCFQTASRVPDTSSVIFGGDLNLREAELDDIGGVPQGFKDPWIETGMDYSKKFSWDLQLNDNTEPYFGKPRCRFDRVYYRVCKKEKLKISGFTLVGQERIPSCCRFPSDHWGLLCNFSLAAFP